MNESLASWVPASVLVGVLTIMVGVLMSVMGVLYKLLVERAKKLEGRVEEQTKELSRIATDMQEKFNRVGERFDSRYVALAQDVAVMKAVSERAK